MKFIMIDAFKGASGKICEHSDMGATYNKRTGKTYSHKLCAPRDLESLPYSDKELAQQSAFKTRATVIAATLKSLSDAQRKALTLLRNARGLQSIRQLVEGIYDKTTQTVPTEALNSLVALGQTSGTGSDGSGNTGGSTGGGGGSSDGGGGFVGE